MERLLMLLMLLMFALGASSVWAAEADSEKLVIAPADFTELEGARVVEAEGTPTGQAVLVEEVRGFARFTAQLGEGGAIPFGLYNTRLMLGTRDGNLKWATVQIYLGGNQGPWFTGFVRGGQPDQWQWREACQPVPLKGSSELAVEVCSKGDSNFYIGQVVLERIPPFWPKEMISDEDFFGGLDRDYPGLDEVIAAADAGDYDRACTELVAHFRSAPRKAAGSLGGIFASDPAAKTDKEPSEIAKLLLEDKMILEWSMERGKSTTYCTQEYNKIPPTVFSFADPYEWHKLYKYPGRRWYGWFLTANLDNLASAYAATGDDRFARKAMDLIKRRIDEWGPFPKAFFREASYPNEYYIPSSFGETSNAPSWNRSSGVRHGLIEAVWRALTVTGGCEAISDRERIEALKLCLLMTRYVQDIRDYQNGVHPKYVWLIQAGNWLPEFPEVVDMSENGIYALLSFMDDCHYPDGAYVELCYYRHGRFAEAARDAAAQGHDVSKYLEKLRPCFDLNIWLTKPMGNFPWINDTGGGKHVDHSKPGPPGYAKLGLVTYPDDPYLRYAYSFGQEGEAPQPTSRNFPWCGFMVMRTGWEPDGLHLVCDGGRDIGSHNHKDQMNIVLSAYGSTLLCDNGYVGTGFHAPDRTHYISHPRGHNLLLVDQMNHTSNAPNGKYLVGWRAWGNAPIDNFWLSAEGYDYAETYYDRPYRSFEDGKWQSVDNAKQQRRILFLKPPTGTPYWVVYDLVQPKGEPTAAEVEHNLQLLFHFTPTSSAQVIAEGAAIRNTAENAGLLILPRSDRQWQASIVNGDARPEENYWQGFVSGGAHNPLVPNDCGIFEYNGTVPAGVVSVLYPYPNDGNREATADLLAASRDDTTLTTDQACGLQVALHDGTDIIMAAAEPGTMTSFGEFTCDGRITAIRRDTEGNITSILLVEGSLLKSADRVLLDTPGRKVRYLECGPGEGIAATGVTLKVEGLAVTGLEWAEEAT